MQAAACGVEAKVGIAVVQAGRAEIPPAAILAILDRGESTHVTARKSAGCHSFTIAEAATRERCIDAGIAVPRLRLQHDRAAQCVQPIDRTGVEQCQGPDRGFRDKVERNRIAERLIEPRAIKVGGKTLRLTL